MYDTYIFDLYGTLVDIHTDEEAISFWEKMCAFFIGYDIEYEAKELKYKYEKLIECETEKLYKSTKNYCKDRNIHVEIDIFQVFKEMFIAKGFDIEEYKYQGKDFNQLIVETASFFRLNSREYIRLYEGAAELLRDLKKRGKRVILLSNAQKLFTLAEIEALGIDIYFDKIYLSSDYGVKKPDQRFFELPFKEFTLDKKKTIMIGNDQTTDIYGASSFGYATCYLHSNISPEKTGVFASTYELDPIDLITLRERI